MKRIEKFGMVRQSSNHVRDWIDVRDHVRALWWAYQDAPAGFVVNIGAQQELSNRQLAQMILQRMPQSTSQIVQVPDRPGHDFRYANDISRLQQYSNWQPQFTIEQSLAQIVQWYQNAQSWWQPRWEAQS